MSTHLIIKDGSIIGEVDLTQKSAILPFACFPGFSFVEIDLIDPGSLKDLRKSVRSALYVGIYYPGGVCLPVYPLISKNGLVIYQLNSPDDQGFIEAHEKQFSLNSMAEALGILGFMDWSRRSVYKNQAAELIGYKFRDRSAKLKSILNSHGLSVLKWGSPKNDVELTENVLSAFGLSLSKIFDLAVRSSIK